MRLIREFLILIYLERKLPTIPKVINIDLKNKTMHLTFVEGERALEWVLKRYGTKGLNVAQFKSFHGLDTNPIVASAFAKLKSSTDKNAKCFKKAIKLAYEEFHNLNFAHGDPSPRNLVYDGKIIHLIDFDRTRLSFNPQAIDRKQLSHWYDL